MFVFTENQNSLPISGLLIMKISRNRRIIKKKKNRTPKIIIHFIHSLVPFFTFLPEGGSSFCIGLLFSIGFLIEPKSIHHSTFGGAFFSETILVTFVTSFSSSFHKSRTSFFSVIFFLMNFIK